MKSLLRISLLSLLLTLSPSLWAQRDSIRQQGSPLSLSLSSALLDPITLPASLDRDVESLLEQWYSGYGRKGTARTSPALPASVSVPYTADSTYIRMLNRIPSVMRFSYNPLVREAIELYLYRRRGLLSSMLALSDLYFPDIEIALDKYGLPMELRYLVIVESALNPKAISPAGASGLWQLMLPTGRAYGLNINSLVDERMDPIRSTEAASRFLKDLYKIYGDWWLVLAAYNCGPGNVNRAIKRSGLLKPNFWDIYRFLPGETRRYIPLFIGAYFAMHYSRHYGILPRELGRPLATDYYVTPHRVTFDRISELTGLDRETISTFNPQYRSGIIPGNNASVRLPLTAILKLDSLGEAVVSPELRVNLEGPDQQASARRKQSSSEEASEEETEAESSPSRSRTRSKAEPATTSRQHKVSSGETLSSIAHRHGLTVEELKKANRLRSDKLSVGQSLSIPGKHSAKAAQKHTSSKGKATKSRRRRR